MKKLLILTAAASFALCAQTPAVLPAPLTGVSDAFRNYSAQNLTASFAVVDDGDEVVNPNELYIPKPKISPNKVSTSAVTAPASTMFNQTSNGTLPVTMAGNFTGLGAGFPGWTNQGLLPPDTTMAVGTTQIVQWVNVRLAVLDKTSGSFGAGRRGMG